MALSFECVKSYHVGTEETNDKVATTDWVDGGWTPAEAAEFSRRLRALGCDYITASSGGTSSAQQVPIGEGHQVGFAADIRRDTGMPTMAVGMIYDPHHAESIIASGAADFVAIARGMLFDPRWPWHAAVEFGTEVFYPKQYDRCHPSMRGGDFLNPVREKQLTNIRAAGNDENLLLTPPIRFDLEQALEFIDDDELVEVTPKSIRLRKRFLNPEDRKRAKKQAAAAAAE